MLRRYKSPPLAVAVMVLVTIAVGYGGKCICTSIERLTMTKTKTATQAAQGADSCAGGPGRGRWGKCSYEFYRLGQVRAKTNSPVRPTPAKAARA